MIALPSIASDSSMASIVKEGLDVLKTNISDLLLLILKDAAVTLFFIRAPTIQVRGLRSSSLVAIHKDICIN